MGNFCKPLQYNLECCNLPAKISPYNKIYQSTKFTILGPCFFFGFTQLSLELEAEPTFDSEDPSLLPPCLSSVKKSSSRSSPLANLITCPLGLSSLTYAKHKENKYIRTQRECFQHLQQKNSNNNNKIKLLKSQYYIFQNRYMKQSKGKRGHVLACLLISFTKCIKKSQNLPDSFNCIRFRSKHLLQIQLDYLH